MISSMSMRQALSVWSDLEAAYYGENSYGGDTAEIYAYRLVEYNYAELGREAGENLTALLRVFCTEHEDARILIGSRYEIPGDKFDPKTGVVPPFEHREHVRMIRGSKR